MTSPSGNPARPPARWLAAVAAAFLGAAAAAAQDGLPVETGLPAVRRIKVPVERDDIWPAGDWSPVALAEFERELGAARAAAQERPATFIERAEYSATLAGSELREARFEWAVRQPAGLVSVLPVGQFNMNVTHLEWSDPESRGPPVPALWGTGPAGTTAIVVNRPTGRLVGDWSLPGRRLAASTEFDVELPPAAVSRLTLRLPAGVLLTSTAGELSAPAPAPQPGWNEWRLNLGSQSTCRLRVAPPADREALRPLVLVRNSRLNYTVQLEAVRVLAEFEIDVLEAAAREFHIFVEPEIQVTAVEYGDGGGVSWNAVPSSAGQEAGGREIVVQLPDPLSGTGHTLQVHGISQVKQFVPFALPRIRLQNSIEAAGRATLRLPSPLLIADVKADGYRQIELTADADEGEFLVYRRLRSDGTITIVPTDNKPDLTCRAVTLIQPEPHQWSMDSQWEWTAAAGSTFTTACVVSGMWEIVDVRPVPGEGAGDLSGWKVDDANPARPVVNLSFRNALRPDRPQRVRISARRLAPVAGDEAVVPPLAPVDTAAVEQVVVVTTSPDVRPLLEGTNGIERLAVAELPPEIRALDFLESRLTDGRTRSLVFRSLSSAAGGGLRIEPVPGPRDAIAKAAGPDAESAANSARPGSPSGASAARSPMALHVTARVLGLPSGFDRYQARYRMAKMAADAAFGWSLPRPAELLAVSIDGRPVAPLRRDTTYTVTSLPVAGIDAAAPRDVSVVTIEYRVPSGMHAGPNQRPLVLPESDQPVQHFDLALHLPAEVRLGSSPDGLSFAVIDEPVPWYRRLLGSFARAGDEAVFNPFREETWPALLRSDHPPRNDPPGERVWRASSAVPPSGARLVFWNAAEVQWLSAALLLAALLAGLVARLVQLPRRRGLAIVGMAILSVGTVALSPVLAELAGSALTGVILAALLPQRVLALARPVTSRESGDVAEGTLSPPESTQSFVPVAGLLLAVVGAGLGLSVSAQESSPPSPAARSDAGPNDRRKNDPSQDDPLKNDTVKNGGEENQRPFVDVLIPVGRDGKPAGEVPLAYVPAGLMGRLKRLARADELPAYLIAASTFDGTVDETHRLRVSARFEIHVLAGESTVPVHLPLGIVNLGGADACLVDGRPHPVSSGPGGRGLIVELPGAESLPAAPAVPDQEAVPEQELDAARAGGEPRPPVAGSAPAPLAVRTCAVELRLYPPVDAGRANFLIGMVTVPAGCQTRATLSSAVPLPLLGISPAEAGLLVSQFAATGKDKVAIAPGPTKQLAFFWSGAQEPAASAPAALPIPLPLPPADVQAGISCLADTSAGLVQMRYHIAYRVQAGQVASLLWRIPAGYVLESVQARQLAGYRFEPGENGGRRMLIEFSRPQTGDFSLAATFAFPIDRNPGPMPLPLLDPLEDEAGAVRPLGLRFHQLALRHASDLRVSLAPGPADQSPLKARPVDEFLKEWNAAGARPQQAFDLERTFSLNLAVESLSAVPAVRGLSIARFHRDHLDWTYTAEIAQPVVAQFLYRLQVDPRLRIRSISVQEDGAERRLRWSQIRDTVVVFLNDGSTRAQTLRVDAALPLAPLQEIELPRIRFAAATPGPERITLYHAPDVSVRLVNPEDFPLTPAADAGADPRGERLVARLEVLPEQAHPRVRVEPVLPQISAQTATVLEFQGGAWRFTTGLSYQVHSGRVGEFAVEVPEALAAAIAARSLPASSVAQEPPSGGRVTLTFSPDEPALRQFVAVLSGAADLSRPAWQPPAIRIPDTTLTANLVIVPHGALEPAGGMAAGEMVAVPAWVSDVVPATSIAGQWDAYRWPAGAPLPEFRSTRDVSSKTVADSARFEVWVEPDGALEGRLGLNVSGTLPPRVEFDWPESARPTGLFVDGAFRPLPVPADGRCAIALPAGAGDRLIWLAWVDAHSALPVLSGPLAARLPWPREIPVENCRVSVHLPQPYRLDASPPLAAAQPDDDTGLVPPPLVTPKVTGKSGSVDGALVVLPVPQPGQPFELGASLKLSNQWPPRFGMALAFALGAALLCWKILPLWLWLTRNETVGWLILSAFWWLCLMPSWLGPAIALGACFQALRRRSAPPRDSASASTAHAPPLV